jgi:hypothetical protein
VLAEISDAKNSLMTPETYERSAEHPAAPLVAAVWRESDFGDLGPAAAS